LGTRLLDDADLNRTPPEVWRFSGDLQMKIYRTVSTVTNWEEREDKGDPMAAIGKEDR